MTTIHLESKDIMQVFVEATNLQGDELNRAWCDFLAYVCDALNEAERFEAWMRARGVRFIDV